MLRKTYNLSSPSYRHMIKIIIQIHQELEVCMHSIVLVFSLYLSIHFFIIIKSDRLKSFTEFHTYTQQIIIIKKYIINVNAPPSPLSKIKNKCRKHPSLFSFSRFLSYKRIHLQNTHFYCYLFFFYSIYVLIKMHLVSREY